MEGSIFPAALMQFLYQQQGLFAEEPAEAWLEAVSAGQEAPGGAESTSGLQFLRRRRDELECKLQAGALRRENEALESRVVQAQQDFFALQGEFTVAKDRYNERMDALRLALEEQQVAAEQADRRVVCAEDLVRFHQEQKRMMSNYWKQQCQHKDDHIRTLNRQLIEYTIDWQHLGIQRQTEASLSHEHYCLEDRHRKLQDLQERLEEETTRLRGRLAKATSQEEGLREKLQRSEAELSAGRLEEIKEEARGPCLRRQLECLDARHQELEDVCDAQLSLLRHLSRKEGAAFLVSPKEGRSERAPGLQLRVGCFNDAMEERQLYAAAKAGHSAGRICNVQGAQWRRALHLLRRAGSEPDVARCGAVCAACARQSRWQNSEALLSVSANLVVSNSAVTALQRAALWRLALRRLAAAEQRNFGADVVGLSAALRACRWRWALHLAHHLRRARLHNAFSHNSALIACGEAADTDASGERGPWQLSSQLLLEMSHGSVAPDVVSYTSEVTCSGSRWPRVLDALQRMQVGQVAPNAATLNSAIEACERSCRWDLALALLSRFRTLKSPVTYSAAMMACLQGSRWHLALELLAEMGASLRADLVAFGSALAALELGRAWRLSLGLLQRMAAQQVQASTVCYGSALGACGWRWAVWLLGEMADCRLQPDLVAHTSAGLALAHGAQWRAALDVAAENCVGRSALALACEDSGQHRQVPQLLSPLEPLAVEMLQTARRVAMPGTQLGRACADVRPAAERKAELGGIGGLTGGAEAVLGWCIWRDELDVREGQLEKITAQLSRTDQALRSAQVALAEERAKHEEMKLQHGEAEALLREGERARVQRQRRCQELRRAEVAMQRLLEVVEAPSGAQGAAASSQRG
ncbi:unnamed protein product [Effrenium voratum]|uniref:Pentatricopeptide repeat-containing protein, chloroplastic n=1 Tax=Effrenium voratum TaxID=2562239 RepID=A0AA36HWN2_9DINO|nr:unnamed protein product [Effrenium voratum]